MGLIQFKDTELNRDKSNVSHAIWEEATVNRRVYDVNFSCPALKIYLDKLVDWTELSLNLTAQAQKDMSELGLRAASTINFNLFPVSIHETEV